jgi:hypothetical protein
MPSLDDLPTLATVSSTGDDLLPVYDLTATGSSKVRKLPLNSVLGLAPTGDVVAGAGTGYAVTTRLTIFSDRTAATAATLPAASGVLREVLVQNANTGSGAVTLTSPSTNIFASGSASASATNVVAINTTARFLSNGTSWYRVG